MAIHYIRHPKLIKGISMIRIHLNVLTINLLENLLGNIHIFPQYLRSKILYMDNYYFIDS